MQSDLEMETRALSWMHDRSESGVTSMRIGCEDTG